MNLWRVLIASLVLGLSLGSLVDYAWPTAPLAAGLLIDDRVVPAGSAPEAWLAARREELRQRMVHLRAEDVTTTTTLGELGIEIDVPATLARAEQFAHRGSVVRRLREAHEARRGEVSLPLAWRFDREAARARLGAIALEVDRAPTDARLDLAARKKVPDVSGRELDVEASLAALEAGSHADEEAIDLVVKTRPAEVRLEDLTPVNVDKLIFAHETRFSLYGTGVGRSKNIRRAAAKIDGTVVAPGQVFSFNAHVGERSIANGFTYAPEIQGDELQTGIGGGVCQASTTLYIAALYASLEIIQRQGHSHPSSYAMLGLDATVSWPEVDLKFRNTLPYPLLIHAYFPQPNVIRVELLGGDPVAKVDYTYGIGSNEDFSRRIYVKDFLAPGRRIRRQKGSRGYSVGSRVTVRYHDGRVDNRSYFTEYRPAPEVYWVAPGYSDDELPDLPKEATRSVALAAEEIY